jgi:hypothetical protein
VNGERTITTSGLPTQHRATPTQASDDDRGWVMRLWVLVAVFAAVTVARAVHVGIPLRDPHGAILASRIGLSLAIFVVLSLIDAAVRTPGPCGRGGQHAG